MKLKLSAFLHPPSLLAASSFQRLFWVFWVLVGLWSLIDWALI